MVLYHEPAIVQSPGPPATDRKTHWCSGRSFEPQLQVRHVGIARCQLLVGWHYEPERHTESCHQTDRVAYRRDCRVALFEAPVTKGQLQQRHIRTLWR